LFEFLVLPTPLLLLYLFGYIGADYVAHYVYQGQLGMAALVFISIGPALGVFSVVLMLVIKWGVMGAFRPGNHFMWSWWAIRNEAFQHLFLSTAGAFLLRQMCGTPLLPPAMRLFGLKIGRGCFLGTIDIPEPDVVTIGPHCTINKNSGLQTHLYEDRVMKIGPIAIGGFVSVGAGSTVLYGTELADGCRVGAQSLVMKGEKLGQDLYCVGIPTRCLPVPVPVPAPGADGAGARVWDTGEGEGEGEECKECVL